MNPAPTPATGTTGFLVWLALTLSSSTTSLQADDEVTRDVVIYGGTSAAVTAAVQARRMGRTVVVVSPDRHLGGLSSGGLGWTDTGDKSVIGGLARDFYHRVWRHYGSPRAWRWQTRESYGNRGQGTPAIDGDRKTMWIFEPHVAESVFEDLVGESEVDVRRGEWLDRENGVSVVAGRIVEIRTLEGNTYRGKIFIDATYEGDLLAAAGVEYHVGREANDVYGETWNGNQVGVLHHKHWFQQPIDPWVVPGDPASGLLPRIGSDPPGIRGEGDHRLQAYCFRMCLTDHPDNRVPFPKPKGYDETQYELLLRVLQSGWREVFHKFDPIPNRKTDTNNHGPFSTDNIGFNYDYPEATYERRREIVREHETYQKGLMWFLANDPRVPPEVRERMARWGLARDEFVDNANWPHQIYVREARRMVGRYVMTEHDCLGRRTTPEPVGLGSYTLDSHNVRRYVTPEGHVQNEGDIGVKPPGPYAISYGSLVPKRGQCANLLVPVCVSSSHIAFGSIRMEPVFMILGQSAATAAALAIDLDVAVQDVPYTTLEKRLLADGQVLEAKRTASSGGAGLDTSKLAGVVFDDRDARVTGDWTRSRSITPFVGDGYLHDGNGAKGARQVVFSIEVAPGRHDVRLIYPPHENRAPEVRVVLRADGKERARSIDQRRPLTSDGIAISLGELELRSGKLTVEVSNGETEGYVVVDALWLVPVD